MITVFLYLYILPMVIVLLYAILLDNEIKTMKDLIDVWWSFLIPFFNIFCLGLLITTNIVERIKKSGQLKNYWNRFLNIKLPKIYDTKL